MTASIKTPLFENINDALVNVAIVVFPVGLVAQQLYTELMYDCMSNFNQMRVAIVTVVFSLFYFYYRISKDVSLYKSSVIRKCSIIARCALAIAFILLFMRIHATSYGWGRLDWIVVFLCLLPVGLLIGLAVSEAISEWRGSGFKFGSTKDSNTEESISTSLSNNDDVTVI